MIFSTLYGRSTNGKIKEWSISVLKMGDGSCHIETEHGFEDGKKQLDQRFIGEGKSIGRANETSPYEQACSEAQSAHNRKKDDGYTEDKTAIPSESDGIFLPMLAHRYDKHSSKINFPCWVQPKLDGSRSLARKQDGVVTMWSRKGKPITVPDKIIQELTLMLREGEQADGEIYNHAWTFQRTIAATKKRRGDTDLLEYHIYDSPHLTKTFEERFIDAFPKSRETKRIKIVNTIKVNDSSELGEQERIALGDNYEGLMARNKKSLYKFKHRSYDLQKVKRFIDGEYEIVGFSDGDGRESGLVVWRCVTPEGIEFGVRPKGTHEERAVLFAKGDCYIGKELTVQYFDLTDDGVPRFPVGKIIRDFE